MTADSTMTEDDHLLARFAAGDQRAFDLLVVRHQDRLLNYLSRFTGDYDLALDTAQEAFLTVFQKHHLYGKPGTFRPWLFRIATRLALNARRKQRFWRLFGLPGTERGGRAAGGEVNETGQSAGEDPEQIAQRAEEYRMLWDAVAGLPAKYRAPVLLRMVEEFDYPEIAEALGVKEGTVKSRINRGRKLLAQRLHRLICPARALALRLKEVEP